MGAENSLPFMTLRLLCFEQELGYRKIQLVAYSVITRPSNFCIITGSKF